MENIRELDKKLTDEEIDQLTSKDKFEMSVEYTKKVPYENSKKMFAEWKCKGTKNT